MTFKNLDDIEREKDEEERNKFKKDVSEDIKGIFGSVIQPLKRRKKKKKNKFLIFLKWLGILFLLLFLINLILGNIWLLRFFVKQLIFGG